MAATPARPDNARAAHYSDGLSSAAVSPPPQAHMEAAGEDEAWHGTEYPKGYTQPPEQHAPTYPTAPPSHPGQSYGDRGQSYGDRGQSYGDRGQSYGDRGQSYGEQLRGEDSYGPAVPQRQYYQHAAAAPPDALRPDAPGKYAQGAGVRGNTVVLNFTVQYGSCTSPSYMKMPDYGWRADMGPYISERAYLEVCDEVNDVMLSCAKKHHMYSIIVYILISIGITACVVGIPFAIFAFVDNSITASTSGFATNIVLITTAAVVLVLGCTIGVPLTYRCCLYRPLLDSAMREVEAIVSRLNTRWEVEQKAMWWRFHREYQRQDMSGHSSSPHHQQQHPGAMAPTPTIVIHLHEPR
eukprot:TRINITY_DN1266_c0_g1_i1.p1 TRINITY_DN1266_c0_g1~~TRINITY_DN1266_c0_g1_i1.p1  ORF type:complete len:353 (+),score=71.22 TRINITY_DN1266_c0_g1_i1:194-1252(+)